jgi:hypothetical protein
MASSRETPHGSDVPNRNDYASSRSGGSTLAPLVAGGLLTFCFYSFIPHLPVQRELAERYFCGHPLGYATAALFFVGIAILAFKAVRISTENAALRLDPLGDLGTARTADACTRVTTTSTTTRSSTWSSPTEPPVRSPRPRSLPWSTAGRGSSAPTATWSPSGSACAG